MVWAGVIIYDKTSIIFIDKCIKVNADYHINNVLKLFLAKDAPRLFLGREGDMVFNQDSASCHTAKKTIVFLNKRKAKYIAPAEWRCKSSDAVPMENGIWVILKRRLQKFYIVDSLSQIPRDSLKYFEIPVSRHTRFAQLRKNNLNNHI